MFILTIIYNDNRQETVVLVASHEDAARKKLQRYLRDGDRIVTIKECLDFKGWVAVYDPVTYTTAPKSLEPIDGIFII